VSGTSSTACAPAPVAGTGSCCSCSNEYKLSSALQPPLITGAPGWRSTSKHLGVASPVQAPDSQAKAWSFLLLVHTQCQYRGTTILWLCVPGSGGCPNQAVLSGMSLRHRKLLDMHVLNMQ
jgi:hypothetical protein